MNADQSSFTPAGFFCVGLVTARFYETWDFYTEQLGFRTLNEGDDHVLLAHASGVRLEILRHETDEQDAELVSATDGRGFRFTLEIENVDELYQRLCDAGVERVHSLESLSLGRRSFTVRDPNGVLIRLATREPETTEAIVTDCLAMVR